MVERSSAALDAVYAALAHPVRRSVVERLSGGGARVTDLAAGHDVSLAAVSKHIRVLEEARLVRRVVTGREHWLALDAARLAPASRWLDTYRHYWEASLDRLAARLEERHR